MNINLMNKYTHYFFIVIVSSFGLYGCSKVEYDYKTLGFANPTEMESAFSKGYHTKQKFTEMMALKVAEMAPTSQITASATISKEPAPLLTENTSMSHMTEAAKSDSLKDLPKVGEAKIVDAACVTLQACADAMLLSARTENIGQALEFAKLINAMPKPARGDRKLARKLNADGLNSLKIQNFDEAISLFVSARSADPLDEEIVGNLAYTYGEAKNYFQAEKVAYEGLLINARRANFWSTIALAKQAQGKQNEALQSMWLMWQFAQNRTNIIKLFENEISEEKDENKKSLFVSAKSWLVDGVKPNLNK